ncbi:MAG: FHA domain-containing protein [Pseudomonadota bacterium]
MPYIIRNQLASGLKFAFQPPAGQSSTQTYAKPYFIDQEGLRIARAQQKEINLLERNVGWRFWKGWGNKDEYQKGDHLRIEGEEYLLTGPIESLSEFYSPLCPHTIDERSPIESFFNQKGEQYFAANYFAADVAESSTGEEVAIFRNNGACITIVPMIEGALKLNGSILTSPHPLNDRNILEIDERKFTVFLNAHSGDLPLWSAMRLYRRAEQQKPKEQKQEVRGKKPETTGSVEEGQLGAEKAPAVAPATDETEAGGKKPEARSQRSEEGQGISGQGPEKAVTLKHKRRKKGGLPYKYVCTQQKLKTRSVVKPLLQAKPAVEEFVPVIPVEELEPVAPDEIPGLVLGGGSVVVDLKRLTEKDIPAVSADTAPGLAVPAEIADGTFGVLERLAEEAQKMTTPFLSPIEPPVVQLEPVEPLKPVSKDTGEIVAATDALLEGPQEKDAFPPGTAQMQPDEIAVALDELSEIAETQSTGADASGSQDQRGQEPLPVADEVLPVEESTEDVVVPPSLTPLDQGEADAQTAWELREEELPFTFNEDPAELLPAGDGLVLTVNVDGYLPLVEDPNVIPASDKQSTTTFDSFSLDGTSLPEEEPLSPDGQLQELPSPEESLSKSPSSPASDRTNPELLGALDRHIQSLPQSSDGPTVQRPIVISNDRAAPPACPVHVADESVAAVYPKIFKDKVYYEIVGGGGIIPGPKLQEFGNRVVGVMEVHYFPSGLEAREQRRFVGLLPMRLDGDSREIVIGREEIITVDTPALSRKGRIGISQLGASSNHVKLIFNEGRVMVEDMQSTNGTIIRNVDSNQKASVQVLGLTSGVYENEILDGSSIFLKGTNVVLHVRLIPEEVWNFQESGSAIPLDEQTKRYPVNSNVPEKPVFEVSSGEIDAFMEQEEGSKSTAPVSSSAKTSVVEAAVQLQDLKKFIPQDSSKGPVLSFTPPVGEGVQLGGASTRIDPKTETTDLSAIPELEPADSVPIKTREEKLATFLRRTRSNELASHGLISGDNSPFERDENGRVRPIRGKNPKEIIAGYLQVSKGGSAIGWLPVILSEDGSKVLFGRKFAGKGKDASLKIGEKFSVYSAKNSVAFAGDMAISGKHFSLNFDGENTTIVDEGSTNGTFVNGKKIEPNQSVGLENNDVVLIAEDLSFVFTAVSPKYRRSMVDEAETGRSISQTPAPAQALSRGQILTKTGNVGVIINGSEYMPGVRVYKEGDKFILELPGSCTGLNDFGKKNLTIGCNEGYCIQIAGISQPEELNGLLATIALKKNGKPPFLQIISKNRGVTLDTKSPSAWMKLKNNQVLSFDGHMELTIRLVKGVPSQDDGNDPKMPSTYLMDVETKEKLPLVFRKNGVTIGRVAKIDSGTLFLDVEDRVLIRRKEGTFTVKINKLTPQLLDFRQTLRIGERSYRFMSTGKDEVSDFS